jgi:predicted metal-dependent enzyme (double-stranded beta helix superfamily)
MTMFEKARFIEECRAALSETDPHAAMRDRVASAVGAPARVMRELGAPHRSGVETLYRGDDLTILNVCWGPQMVFHPHDHRMWAVIGIYEGCERNLFFRRDKDGLMQHGSKELNAKDTIPLGAAIIHAVTNPLDRITGAIHVYGGDFFATPRSEWDPETFEEHPYDLEHTMQAFEAANERLRVMATRS